MQRNGFKQFIQALAGHGRDLDILHFTGHRFHDHFMLQKVGPHFLRVCLRLVAFVDRHDHRHFGGLGVIDGFDRLRHHRVIGGNHENDDIRHLSPARTHRGKGRVAGRVEEAQHRATVGFHLIGADVLGDSPGFARDNLGIANRIQKRGFAVVDVPHDRDHGRTRLEILFRILDLLDHLFHVGIRNTDDLVAEFLDDQLGRIGVDRLVLIHHHAHLHEALDHFTHTFGHPVGQLGDDDRLGQLDLADHLFPLDRATHGLLPGAFLLALHRGHRPLTSAFATRQRLVQGQLARTPVVVTALAAGLALFTLTVLLARSVVAPRLGCSIAGFCLFFSRFRRGGSSGFGGGTLGGLFGLLALALFLFRLRAGLFLGLALLALFLLHFGAAALTLFRARLFFRFTSSLLFGLARLGGLNRLQAARHFRVGYPGRTARRITRSAATAAALALTGLGDNNAFALGLHHDILGAPVAKALLHVPRPGTTTTYTQGLLAVSIAH